MTFLESLFYIVLDPSWKIALVVLMIPARDQVLCPCLVVVIVLPLQFLPRVALYHSIPSASFKRQPMNTGVQNAEFFDTDTRTDSFLVIND